MGRTTILQKITDDILTGGRRTTAANTRDVLNEMANTYMSVIHDTASNFTASNPILETKQIGVVSDSLLSSPQYKIGDGINHWNDLPYSSGGAGIPSLQQVTDTGATSNNDIDFIGETDTFYKVRIGNDGTGSGDGNGSVQVYDDDNNSTIEIRGTNGFKVHDNAYSGASLFEVIRDNGVDTDKVVINASKSELTQGTASKLLRLNSSKEIVSSSYDDSALLPETAATIAAINHGTSAKTTLVDADEVTGQDSANSFSLIRTTWLDVWAYIKSKADTFYQTIITYTSFGAFLHAATNKTTPVDADEVGIWDSVSGLFNRVSLANLYAYFQKKSETITNGGNAAYSILSTDKVIVTGTTLTTARIWTLPSAASVNAGNEKIINDAIGTITSTNTITIAVQSGQYLNNVLNGTEVMNNANAFRRLISDGVNNWTFDAGVVRLSAVQTLTNKTVKPRIVTVTQSATPIINIDNGTTFQMTGLAQATNLTTNMAGTPYDGQPTCIQITDNGTARAIALGSNFVASTAQALPTTTVAGVRLSIYSIYRADLGKHEVQFVN